MHKTEVSRGFREIKRQRGKNKRMKTFCLHCQNFLKYGKINLMKALLKHFFFFLVFVLAPYVLLSKSTVSQ